MSPYVFLCCEAVKIYLQPQYDNPFALKGRGNKSFQISIHNKNDEISIDRLKPAFVLSDKINEKSSTLDTLSSNSRNPMSPYNCIRVEEFDSRNAYNPDFIIA
jgi:hypothetical protein